MPAKGKGKFNPRKKDRGLLGDLFYENIEDVEDREIEEKRKLKEHEKKGKKALKADKKALKRLVRNKNISAAYRDKVSAVESKNKRIHKNVKYAQAVLKDKPKYLSKKPKVQTRAAIKRERALGTAVRTLSKVGKAASNPYLFAAMSIFDPTPTQGAAHDEAVRARNEAWETEQRKRYARGGGVRKTRLTDY